MSHGEDRKSSIVSGAKVVVWIAIAYLFPLLLIFLDEAVFRTFFIYNSMPDWVFEIFKVVYFPIKMIFGK